MRIGFLMTVQYECDGRNKGPHFAKGDVYDCTDEFGNRWIERSNAVEIKGNFPPPAKVRWVKVDRPNWTIAGYIAEQERAEQAAEDEREAARITAKAKPAADATLSAAEIKAASADKA